MDLADQIAISNQQLKVQKAWDEHTKLFLELEMKVDEHRMKMLREEIAARTEVERWRILRGARLSFNRETKRISQLLHSAEESGDYIEYEMSLFQDLLSPDSVHKNRVGRCWASLGKHTLPSLLRFTSSDGTDLFKKRPGYEPTAIATKTASDFIYMCRTNALLVKLDTPTYRTLNEVVHLATANATKDLQRYSEEVSKQTEVLHSVLRVHWERQGV